MSSSIIRKSQLYIATEEQPRLKNLCLGKDERFVIIVRDESPEVVPLDVPGTYCVDIEQLTARHVFPVAVMVLSVYDAGVFAKQDDTICNQIIDMVETKMAAREGRIQ